MGLGLGGPNDLFQQSVDRQHGNLSPEFREVDVMGKIVVEDWGLSSR